MGKTISTHNGSVANRDHNIRNPKATDKQGHIDKSLKGENETLIDEHPREAYKRIFGEALDEYNERQNRQERKIKDYFNHIEADQKKHAVYEMIVQVGDRKDTGIDAPTERAVIKEFIAKWPERNPNLELIGAYIHADERDGTLHAHLDYVPVAHGYKNGLHTQNGLVKALGEQGFETAKKDKITAQIRWEARENKALEEICNRHGIEVEHPDIKRKHFDTPEYKEYAAELDAVKLEIKNVNQEYDDLFDEFHFIEQEYLKLDTEIQTLEEKKNNLSYACAELEEKADFLKSDIKKSNEILSGVRLNIIELSQTEKEKMKSVEALEADNKSLTELCQKREKHAGILKNEIVDFENRLIRQADIIEANEKKLKYLENELKEKENIIDKLGDVYHEREEAYKAFYEERDEYKRILKEQKLLIEKKTDAIKGLDLQTNILSKQVSGIEGKIRELKNTNPMSVKEWQEDMERESYIHENSLFKKKFKEIEAVLLNKGHLMPLPLKNEISAILKLKKLIDKSMER